MKLSHDDVRHIAKLARLGLTEAEVEKFSIQLSDILSHAKMLEEIDTTNVEPIAQITGLKDVFFDDEVENFEYKKELLNQSPMDKQDNMIKVRSIL